MFLLNASVEVSKHPSAARSVNWISKYPLRVSKLPFLRFWLKVYCEDFGEHKFKNCPTFAKTTSQWMLGANQPMIVHLRQSVYFSHCLCSHSIFFAWIWSNLKMYVPWSLFTVFSFHFVDSDLLPALISFVHWFIKQKQSSSLCFQSSFFFQLCHLFNWIYCVEFNPLIR